MRLGFTIAVATALFTAAAFAQGQNFSQVQIKTTDLGNRTYMLEGLGGNIVVACGDDAVIQVDTEFAPLHDKIKAAIDQACGGKPIKYIVNTHFHGDHTGGNGEFATEDKATIVAHRNLALRLEHGTTNGLSGQKTAPVAKEAIPTLTYDSNNGPVLEVVGRTAVVGHPNSAHTDTDSWVFFPEANVLAMGDTTSLGPRYPTIDYANGGSINGIINTVTNYLHMTNGQTKYVPGHGPLATRADIVRYRDMLTAVSDLVRAEIQANKTEDQAVADKPLASIGKLLGSGQQLDDNMVRMVYRSLKGNQRVQPVFFATDRKINEGPTFVVTSITAERSLEIKYGSATVSVPKSHTIGHVERPRSWLFGLFQEKETDENAFRIQTLLPLSREQIIAALQQDADSLLLFVHGYNVMFDEAVFKAAQIAYDSNFQGSVLVFSWPSMGGWFKYDYDYQSALFSPGHLLSVLSMVTHEIGNKKIFVVAHSLGNQILVDALQQAALAHVALNISELVLAAPDVDKDVFLSKAQQIKSVAGNITLYASSSDKALLASDKKTWGSRLGYIGADGPFHINGVETIDVSTLGDDMFGLNHGTFSDNKVALDDLGRLITSGIHPPGVRSPILRYMPDRLHTLYWMYPK